METNSKKISHIGTVIHYNTEAYNEHLEAWEGEVFPAIERLAKTYTQLGVGQFDDKVFKDLLKSGITNVQKRCEQDVCADFKKSKSPFAKNAALAAVAGQMVPLEDQLTLTRNAFRNTKGLLWKDCTINEAGRPVIDKEAIKRRFSIIITTPEQSEFYDRFLKLKEAWDNLAGHLKSIGYSQQMIYRNPVFSGVMVEGQDLQLLLLPESIVRIQQLDTKPEKEVA